MSVTPGQKLTYLPLSVHLLDQVMPIELEAYPEPWSRGMFLEEIRSKRSYFCAAMLHSELVGYGGFWLVLDEAHVTSVTISTQCRGQGMGRDLMQHLLQAAMDRGVRQATLEVRGSNDHALRLYESLGFERIGLRKGYYSTNREDAVIMQKEW